MSIKWLYMDQDQPGYDLVASHLGNDIDVIQDGTDSDVWRVIYGNVTVADKILGRESAKVWAEENLDTVDSIMRCLVQKR
jgi:hypothetical protein